ncbi:MAG: bestrophin family protein [Spirulinaceae cyanobacterium]
MNNDDRNWLKLIVNLRRSVLPGIAMQVIAAVLFAGLVTWADYQGLPVRPPDQDSIASLIPELVLGLLLVFRTDTAYTRFWEGSGLISDIVDLSRSLARNIWVYVAADDAAAQQEKIAHTRMVGLFLAAVKQHLRGETVDAPMQTLLTPDQCQELEAVNHMPLRISQWLSAYLHKMHQQDKLETAPFAQLSAIIDRLTLSMGGCERILTTPLPLPYAIHLKHLLFLYFLIIPFRFVGTFTWGTPIAVGVISFALLGIEEIGLEIENPFGYDANDLPLDAQTQDLWDDIEEILTQDRGKSN